MNKKLIIQFASFCFLLVLTACKKEIVLPINDQSKPSAALLQVKELKSSDNEMEFELDVVVFRDSKNIEDQLDKDNFYIDTIQHRINFSVTDVDLIKGKDKQPYQVLMLMDQSGSISGTDRNNYRLQAADIFSRNLGQGGEAMLWSFPNRNYKYVVKKNMEKFTSDSVLLSKHIDSLLGKTGGGTPLYQSQDSALVFLNKDQSKTAKFLLTFTDGEDGNRNQAENSIYKAKRDHIALFNVGLKSRAEPMQIRQANETGGAYLLAKEAQQLISFFGNLGNLLNKSATYYKTTWKITFSKGNLPKDYRAPIYLKIKLPYSEEPLEVPFFLENKYDN